MAMKRQPTIAAAKDDQPLTPAASMIGETVKSDPQPKPFTAPARSGTKRSADDNTKQSKKKKKTTAAAGDDSEESFKRVFKKVEVLAVLRGIVKFTALTGSDPLKYPASFYQYVKDKFHFSVTHNELKEKVPRLKLKFEKKMKGCKDGKTPTFSKPIEKEIFEFGKQILVPKQVFL